jgi:predicted permease
MPISAILIIAIGIIIAWSVFFIVLYVNRKKSKKTRIRFSVGLFISYLVFILIISLIENYWGNYEDESFGRTLWRYLTNPSAIALYVIMTFAPVFNWFYFRKKGKEKSSNKE